MRTAQRRIPIGDDLAPRSELDASAIAANSLRGRREIVDLRDLIGHYRRISMAHDSSKKIDEPRGPDEGVRGLWIAI